MSKPEKIKHQTAETPRCSILKEMVKLRPMSRDLCLACKGGRLLCGQSPCPLISKIQFQGPAEQKLSQDMFGPSPSIFVGWHGYPEVNVGPMTGIETGNAALLDDPGAWYGLGFDEIINLRTQLVRSKKPVDVHTRERYILENQEIALSVKPIDVESHFKKKPSYSMNFSPISQPMGPTGVLERMRITENPKIPKRVDYVVNDELRAADAASILFRENHDVYYLTNILSSGALGMDERKKLVPTRWSITAVDDIIAKNLMEEIRTYPAINDFLVYSNQYLENHFEILLIPGGWEFEQFEAWAPGSLWTLSRTKPVIVQENEAHEGRTKYAFNEGGGYYAGRLGVVEALWKMKRQARCVVFREIYEGYVVPVGVWEVRENVRKAMQNPPKKFNTLKEALQHIKEKLRLPLADYMKKSEILKQRRLDEFY
ncbi:MAG: Nre family DNA repair protein [Candidatus Altiarchaeota archaeon]